MAFHCFTDQRSHSTVSLAPQHNRGSFTPTSLFPLPNLTILIQTGPPLPITFLLQQSPNPPSMRCLHVCLCMIVWVLPCSVAQRIPLLPRFVHWIFPPGGRSRAGSVVDPGGHGVGYGGVWYSTGWGPFPLIGGGSWVRDGGREERSLGDVTPGSPLGRGTRGVTEPGSDWESCAGPVSCSGCVRLPSLQPHAHGGGVLL